MTDLNTLLLFGYCMGYGIAVGITWALLLNFWRVEY